MSGNIFDEKDSLSVTALRMLAADTVEKAKSGHPGMPLGAAPMAYALWSRFLRHDPANPGWTDRDRFVLSAGHGSALLYSLLHLFGYGVSMDDLKSFRQWGSRTPGHPEFRHTPGVETTTGPLGQGLATAVGMAMAEKYLASVFNTEDFEIVGHHTYVIAGDGDMMEGISHEAASLAGHLKLGRLVCLYDDNGITIEGRTDLAFSDDTAARFKAYGWKVLRVDDGNSIEQVGAALKKARRSDRPVLVMVKTHIGFGTPKQDTSSVHGEPLGEKAMKAAREFYGWTETPFHIPNEVAERFSSLSAGLKMNSSKWEKKFARYARKYPEKAAQYRAWHSGALADGWKNALPVFAPEAGAMATRDASGKIINALADVIPNLVGGSADLAPSNKTGFAKYPARDFHFGIREHGMAAAVNGMALHGGVIPFGATFFVFSDYMKPSIRLAALMGCRSIFVFTHDGLGVGEDGPTHQPVEQLAALRSVPGLKTIRPADANESSAAWGYAVESGGPVCLAFTRQKLPVLALSREQAEDGVRRGAYIARDCASRPDVILMASGSEVHIIIEAARLLEAKNIRARAVSVPCMENFAAQPEEYRNSVLPPDITRRVAVEAGSSMPWRAFVGPAGVCVCVDRFGASAPYEKVYQEYGLTAANVAEKAAGLVGDR